MNSLLLYTSLKKKKKIVFRKHNQQPFLLHYFGTPSEQ